MATTHRMVRVQALHALDPPTPHAPVRPLSHPPVLTRPFSPPPAPVPCAGGAPLPQPPNQLGGCAVTPQTLLGGAVPVTPVLLCASCFRDPAIRKPSKQLRDRANAVLNNPHFNALKQSDQSLIRRTSAGGLMFCSEGCLKNIRNKHQARMEKFIATNPGAAAPATTTATTAVLTEVADLRQTVSAAHRGQPYTARISSEHPGCTYLGTDTADTCSSSGPGCGRGRVYTAGACSSSGPGCGRGRVWWHRGSSGGTRSSHHHHHHHHHRHWYGHHGTTTPHACRTPKGEEVWCEETTEMLHWATESTSWGAFPPAGKKRKRSGE